MDKGANPFLFTDDDYDSAPCVVSNPFLMAEDLEMEPASNDNPFLSQTAVTMASTTNPFAFDPMDLGPAEAQPAIDFTSAAQMGYTNTQMSYTNAFMNIVDDIQPEAAVVETTPVFAAEPASICVTSPPQKPTELNLMYSNSMSNAEEIAAGFKNGGPARPPPPRPPPSKETQDLLMSVMGAMDATSSSLLDKIPPTR